MSSTKDSYTVRKKNLKIRKDKKSIDSLTDGDKYNIILSYIEGTPPLDICEKFIIDHKRFEEWLGRIYTSLVNRRETNALIASQGYSKAGGYEVKPNFRPPTLVNDEFLSLLSDEDSVVCSPAELAYAKTYAQTGDNKTAIAASGLDIGLMKKSKSTKGVLQLRGIYLRNKPCIAEAIEQLKQQLIDDLYVDKSVIQNELVQQINQLREEVADNPRARGHLMKAIELLGKTIPGTFAERVEVTQVDPQMALSTLVEMAQKAEAVELSTGVELLSGGTEE